MGMGLTAECVRKKYGVTREDADQFALRSHQKALEAQAAGKFDDEIVPVEVETTVFNGKPKRVDDHLHEGRRAARGHLVEALAKLKPAFHDRRHRDRRQLLADQRRRGGGHRHVREEGAGAGPQTDGPLRQLRGRRRSAGDHGHRSGGRDSRKR